MPSLMSDGGVPDARCQLCGKTAVGPCARCRRSVCGDCCELTVDGATTFAICLTCVKHGGRSLAPAYRELMLWIGAILLGLVAIAGLVVLTTRR